MKKTFIAACFAAFIALNMLGCSKDHVQVVVPAKTYVIVPGSWSAPYAWESVRKNLQAQGQKVFVVQLPGHGSDQTPFNTLTLDKYRDAVVHIIDSLNTKVILVGHSMAGMVVSEVAESIPSKIDKMIYVGAFLPVSGQTLLDLAMTDTTSLLVQNLILVNGGLSLDVPSDKIATIFVQDGSPSIQALAVTNYRSEPGIPFTNPVTLTVANYGSVEKYYIHTLQDHAVTLKLQNRMVASAGLTKIYNINTSHSPFLSSPDSLSILLQKIASK